MRVLINSSAGTAIAMSREQLSQSIEVPLKAAGHDVEFEVVPPEEFDVALKRAAAADGDALIIGGGDGSVRSAAIELMGSDKALGLIPLGTMNLAGPRSWNSVRYSSSRRGARNCRSCPHRRGARQRPHLFVRLDHGARDAVFGRAAKAARQAMA